MAEIGVVRFAQVAREVAEAALSQYRSRFSKHTFTQPTLLAILCLMRYEDWTYREAEVRLREHAELRAALGLERVPDYTTLYRCVRRTDEQEMTRLLHETIRRMPPPPTEERWSPSAARVSRRERSAPASSTGYAIEDKV
jgi:hypothetical protein